MNNEWPLVSVVVPAYNAEKYIEECLRSVLQQDYPSLQVIVVDDGSTDGTAERVQRLGAAVTYARQSNSGSAVARNLGVRLSKGEFITFNDSDDLWAPHRLRQQVAFLRGQTEYKAVCGRFMAVPDSFSLADAARQSYRQDAVLNPEKSGWTYLQLLRSSIYQIDALMVRSELMKSIRFNPNYRSGQDFDFFLQLVHATPIAQLDNLYAFYRQNPHSITHRPHMRNYRGEIITAAIQEYGRRDQLGREITVEQLNDLLSRSWFGHGYSLYRAGWFRESAKSLRRSLKHDPMRLSAYRYLLLGWLRRLQDQTPAHAGL